MGALKIETSGKMSSHLLWKHLFTCWGINLLPPLLREDFIIFQNKGLSSFLQRGTWPDAPGAPV